MKKKPINVDEIGKINLLVTLLFIVLFVLAIIGSAIYLKKNSHNELKIQLQEKYIESKKNDKNFFLNNLDLIDKEIKENINEELKSYIQIVVFFLLLLIFFILKINKFTSNTINKFKEQFYSEKRKLIQSEDYLKQYTTILENSTVVLKLDKNGNFTYVSDSFCKLMEYEKEELIGKPYYVIDYIIDSNILKEEFDKVLKDKTSIKKYIRNRSKSGKELYFIMFSSPILDENNEVLEFVSYRIDITKENELTRILEKQNEELLKSQKILNEAQRIAHIGNWEHNYITDMISFSNEGNKILGFDREIKKFKFDELNKVIYKDDSYLLRKPRDYTLNKDNQFSFEHRIVKENGKLGYVQVKGEYIYDENGRLIRSIGIINDITKRIEAEKELEEKNLMLLQQSKMAAMGEMLSNIAHQWRQPLSLISTAATGAKMQNEMNSLSDEKINETFSLINDTVQYLSKTIDDFRNFFKPNTERKYFNMSDVMFKSISLVKPQFKNRNIDIIKNINDFELYGLENEFLQVVINLLNNARDQLEKIEDVKLIIINTYISEDSYVIEIKDNGKGIKEEIINRVFEPYFTTKHNSEGTGIGLYMCEEIIVKHMKGQIKVENTTFTYNSKSYKGAQFTITLPISKS